jgi:DNA-binding MarR family transcriptional regulator
VGQAPPRRRGRARGLGLTGPRVSYRVGRLDRLLRRHLAEALDPHGLSLAEYTTLSVLAARTGLSNAQLARRSLITPQAMNEVLARLEARDLVRRRTDPAHARIRRAELTDDGKRVLAAADAGVDAVEARMLDELSDEERNRLGELLDATLRGLDPPE